MYIVGIKVYHLIIVFYSVVADVTLDSTYGQNCLVVLTPVNKILLNKMLNKTKF